MDRGAWWATIHRVTEESDTPWGLNSNSSNVVVCYHTLCVKSPGLIYQLVHGITLLDRCPVIFKVFIYCLFSTLKCIVLEAAHLSSRLLQRQIRKSQREEPGLVLTCFDQHLGELHVPSGLTGRPPQASSFCTFKRLSHALILFDMQGTSPRATFL